ARRSPPSPPVGVSNASDGEQRTVSGAQHTHGPAQAIVTRRAAERLRAGYLWVYASDVVEVALPGGEDPPALLQVADNRGFFLGTALYSPSSQIAMRLVSRQRVDHAAWLK